MDDVLYKHSSVTRSYPVDFTALLSGDTTITVGSTVTAINSAGAAVTAVIGTVSQSGMILTAVLQAGTDGEDYRITFSGIGTTTGKTETFMLEMRVRNYLTGAV